MTEGSLADEILRCHPTAIIAIGRERRVRYANRAALHLLGGVDESVDGKDVVELLGGDESLSRTIDSVFTDREERRLRLAFRKAGSEIEVGLTLLPLPEGGPMTMLLSCRDIEKRTLLDDRAVQIERLAATGRLVGGLAHQLRNPLAALSALVENLAAETPTSDPRAEYTSRMLNQVARIEHLIRACLEFSLDPSAVRQRSTAESIGRAAIDSFAAVCGATPQLAVESGAGEVVVCGEQIAKCLRLLLENALDACGEVSKIRLVVAPEPRDAAGFVRFVVRDEGPGIESSDLARLFEPFYPTKTRGEGIGLAVAQALALNNGGALEVVSRPGDTQFILRLRAAEVPRGTDQSARAQRERSS